MSTAVLYTIIYAIISAVWCTSALVRLQRTRPNASFGETRRCFIANSVFWPIAVTRFLRNRRLPAKFNRI